MQENQAPDAVLRAFVAVAISDEIRRGIARLQDDLKKVGAKVGWIAPANIHLTLVFLGNIFQAKVGELGSALDAIAREFEPFRMEVAGAGWFGSAASPRVLWVGIAEPNQPLAALQGRVGEAVQSLDIPVEDRAFKPHLTLGRVRSKHRAVELTSVLGSAKNTAYGSVEIRRLLLMQSHLEHQGVRYSILHESALKGA